MRAVDTNILARFYLRDDAVQGRVAAGVFSAGDVFVPKTVVLELEWTQTVPTCETLNMTVVTLNLGDQNRLLAATVGPSVLRTQIDHASSVRFYTNGGFARIDPDGNAAYEAHLVKADGTPATVYVNKQFQVVSVQAGMPRPAALPNGASA